MKFETDRRARARFLLTAGCAIVTAPAGATTLADALAATYANNPTLNAQRASLRATDEQAAIARAGGRPQADLSATYVRGIGGLRAVNGYNQAVNAGANLNVPIYQGGRVRNAIRAADARSATGRGDLRAAEGDLMVAAITAYADVLRDREVLAHNRANVDALDGDMRSSATRQREGDLTRTDVSQSQARLEIARGALATVEARLARSELDFRRVTGLAPGPLAAVPPLPSLPADADDAERVALADNPALEAAAGAIRAARYDAAGARGAGLPTLSLTGTSSYYAYKDRFAGYGDTSGNANQVGASFTLPLYQGGIVSARVRAANDAVAQALDQQVEVERQVVTDVRADYADYRAALRSIEAGERAVEADTSALTGVRTENKAGFRQLLDVLNAELELLNAREGLAAARHDALVAGARLLASMGIADLAHLAPDAATARYDAEANARAARRALLDLPGARAAKAGLAKPVYGPVPPIADDSSR
ncbi:TolC family outer membrane protein [Sphingomonas sp.]|uniref:TolC family outer membrane protein n=1 Tax=Sphingomonas sp. TaxID=28214 RepID=UPI003AFFCA90